MQARGARRQRKAWGGAQRNPRISHAKTFAKPAERGDRVKPGVERSGTPGPAMQEHLQSPRSGRQRKVRGRALRHPRSSHAKTFAKPAERGDSVKPGVERCGTPGPAMQKHLQSPRAGDSVKPGGGALRHPRTSHGKTFA